MALKTHSPSHPHSNKHGHGVFGDVYTITKDMHTDHHNPSFDFQIRLPPLPVTVPPISVIPLVMPTFCLFKFFFLCFCVFPFQNFLGSREAREFFSGALAGAMTKAILAPLETIRFALFPSFLVKSTYLFVVPTWVPSGLIQWYSCVVICKLCMQDKNGCWCWIQKYCW